MYLMKKSVSLGGLLRPDLGFPVLDPFLLSFPPSGDCEFLVSGNSSSPMLKN